MTRPASQGGKINSGRPNLPRKGKKRRSSREKKKPSSPGTAAERHFGGKGTKNGEHLGGEACP